MCVNIHIIYVTTIFKEEFLSLKGRGRHGRDWSGKGGVGRDGVGRERWEKLEWEGRSRNDDMQCSCMKSTKIKLNN